MQYRWLATAALAASVIACGDSEGDGTGGSGATGNTGGVGNSGNVGGVGNTGNIGGVGNTGNTGGVGNTGNMGGVGNVGGDPGGSGGVGGNAGGMGGSAGGMGGAGGALGGMGGVGGMGGNGGTGGMMGSTGNAWVNELHYDNDGADADEGVEIAGEAGLDLTGWSIVAYNGNDGQGYSTTPLTGVLPDQQNGYGTIWFPIAPLQNGAPDGLALIDGTGAVLQFLSYEGSFAAAGGPAMGMTSVDIGVEEIGTTPVGQSLQLVGTGLTYSDFTWAAPATSSHDLVNPGQTFGAPPSFTCDPDGVAYAFCTIGSDVTCECVGCVTDGLCEDGVDDCVCPDCVAEAFCAGGACTDDGFCDPYFEGCSCADCVAHPSCP